MQNYQRSFKESLTSYLGLFTSMSTLLCCALPALLVSLGMGASMITLTKVIPQITWVGEYKNYVFSFAFFMLTVSSILTYRNRNAPCPIDPKLRDACLRGRKYSKYVLILSWICLSVGFFFAFVAQLLT
ncbi:hypothetical protein CIK05_07230 [Bdellovibrio sp. qaytius]|nr:hypothetical protein CIK05_07230 [Bdellovibrio sp. qaytius]